MCVLTQETRKLNTQRRDSTYSDSLSVILAMNETILSNNFESVLERNGSDILAASPSSFPESIPQDQTSTAGYLGLDLMLEWLVTSVGLQIDMTTTIIDKAVWVMDRHRVSLSHWEGKIALIASAIFLLAIAGRSLGGRLRPSLISQIICLWLSMMWAAQSIWIFETTCLNTVSSFSLLIKSCGFGTARFESAEYV